MTKIDSNILLVLFVSVIFTMPFSPNLNSTFVIGLAVASFWLYFKYKKFSEPYFRFAIPWLLFWTVFFLGLIHTHNLRSAAKLFEAQYPMLIFPVLLFMVGNLWDRQLLYRLFIGFALVCFLCGLFIQGSLLVDIVQNEGLLFNFFYWRTTGSELSNRIGLHPTYFSMFAIFSIGIVYEFFIKDKPRNIAILGCLFVIYFSLLTVQLSSRIAFVVLLITLLVILIKMFNVHRKITFIFAGALLAGLVLIFSSEGFGIRSRLENPMGLLNIFTHEQDPGDASAQDRRTLAWRKSLSIIEDNFYFGIGTGDVREIFDTDELDHIMNSHNQYLDALIRNGLPGLIVLLLMYFSGVYTVRFKMLYFIFALTISLTSITENILERQKGAVFFASFSVLLYRYSTLDRSEKMLTDATFK